jgi:hypothetical protein
VALLIGPKRFMQIFKRTLHFNSKQNITTSKFHNYNNEKYVKERLRPGIENFRCNMDTCSGNIHRNVKNICPAVHCFFLNPVVHL